MRTHPSHKTSLSVRHCHQQILSRILLGGPTNEELGEMSLRIRDLPPTQFDRGLMGLTYTPLNAGCSCHLSSQMFVYGSTGGRKGGRVREDERSLSPLRRYKNVCLVSLLNDYVFRFSVISYNIFASSSGTLGPTRVCFTKHKLHL